ncbi:MAG: hypothetical protein Fur0046_05530 [Cyanobacteria bacterium J069]
MGLVPLYVGQSQNSSGVPAALVSPPSEQDILREEEKGFSLVLQREPENQTALEGLANARIKLKDYAGAIAPLEKLASLYPDQEDYQTLLKEAKQQSQ